MTGQVRLPLSGNVWQDINPFRQIFERIGPFNLFSINLGRSAAPEVEAAVLEIASYGRQLGRMGEALIALIESDPDRKFSKEQQAAIEDFKALMREIARVKKSATTKTSLPSLFGPGVW